MYSFLFLSIPSVLVFYIFSNRKYSPRKFIIPFVSALTIAIIFTFIKFLFVAEIHNIRASLVIHTLYLSRFTFTPVVFFAALTFFLLKDDLEYKNEALTILLLTFYSIFLPFLTLRTGEKKSFFMMIANPLLFLSMIIIINYAILTIKKGLAEKRRTLISIGSVVCVLALFMPPFIQAVWYFNTSLILLIALSVITTAAGAFMYAVKTNR